MEKTELVRPECKIVSELFLEGRYKTESIYDMVRGKRRMVPVVAEAIEAFTNVKTTTAITHEELLQQAADRFRRLGAEGADVDSQIRPEVDAAYERDLTTEEVRVNHLTEALHG